MQRSRGSRRGQTAWILVAAGVGFLVGSWNILTVHSAEPDAPPSAAEMVALRFPQDMRDAPVVEASALGHGAVSADPAMRNAQLALFEPEPMAPPRMIAPAQALSSPAQPADMVPARAAPAPAPRVKKPVAAKPHSWEPASAPRETERPRYMLDDAQIASIKRRLHLTPEQEQMWPAVEVALRNIGVERELHARTGHAAAIDPDSPEVQDLKSAAIPLLMSFSDEQKDEVRDLAHGMGLDQLASEF